MRGAATATSARSRSSCAAARAAQGALAAPAAAGDSRRPRPRRAASTRSRPRRSSPCSSALDPASLRALRAHEAGNAARPRVLARDRRAARRSTGRNPGSQRRTPGATTTRLQLWCARGRCPILDGPAWSPEDLHVRRPYVIAAAFALLVAGALVAAAYVYDHGRKDTIAPGVDGRRRRRRRADAPAGAATSSRASCSTRCAARSCCAARRARWHLTAREAQISADVDAAASAIAVDRSREGNFLGRAVRSLDRLGSERRPAAADDLQRPRGRRGCSTACAAPIERKPRDASVSFSGSGVAPIPSAAGLLVPASTLHRRIRAAILSPTARPHVHASAWTRSSRRSPPSSSPRSTRRCIIVNRVGLPAARSTRTCKPVKTYKIAVGRQGLETPAGLYDIQDKQVNPSWHVPNSAWAGKLAGQGHPARARRPDQGALDGHLRRRRHPRGRPERVRLARQRRLARLRAHARSRT